MWEILLEGFSDGAYGAPPSRSFADGCSQARTGPRQMGQATHKEPGPAPAAGPWDPIASMAGTILQFALADKFYCTD